MGDVKMGGMLGAFLGPYAALAVFLGALLGAVTGGLLMAAGKMRRRPAFRLVHGPGRHHQPLCRPATLEPVHEPDVEIKLVR